MEEILASIRRIIEDNDTDLKPSVASPPRPSASAPSAAESELGEPPSGAADGDSVIEVDAFRAELRGSSDRAAAAPHKASPASGSTGLAEPRRTSPNMAEIQSAARRPAEAAQPAQPQPRVEPRPNVGPTAAAKPAGATQPASAAAARPFESAKQPVTPLRPAARSEGAAASQPEKALEEKAEKAPERAVAPQRSAIISERTGRQVAAAFGELSEAFQANRRKSFDEMAEQMIRPMLQDWLDNNLPVLVERLVREEIDRIARGEA